MTSQPNQRPEEPTAAIPGFEEIAVHLSQQLTSSPLGTNVSDTSSLPVYLNRPATRPVPLSPASTSAGVTSPSKPILRVDAAHESTARAASAASNPVLLNWQQLRAVFGGSGNTESTERGPALPNRPLLHQRDRFAGDPCDDVRLQWADSSPTWWHFDVEARMVDRETLWIMEQLEAFFHKYLKPIWWDRFVEGVNDFLSMIHHELVRPVWLLLSAPFRAVAHLIPDVDWPWNFELRGPNASVKQSPFRRIVFDNYLAMQVVERLWESPDEFLEVGQTVTRDDFAAVSRVPIDAPSIDGRFSSSDVGLLKRFNLRDVWHTFTRMLLFTRGSRSWTYGREMLGAGIGTARPLAMVEDRLGPFRFRSFVLTEQVEGTPLPEFLANSDLNTLELDRLAGQFARIWHTLGELRIVHGAMHASNFVVTPEGQLKLINLDGTWRHWFDVTFLHRRDRDWLRFMKAWRGQPEIGAAFRAAVARHFEETAVTQRQLSQPLTLHMQRAA